MKTINETFTDEEFEVMKYSKENSECRSWHDYILMVVQEHVKSGVE